MKPVQPGILVTIPLTTALKELRLIPVYKSRIIEPALIENTLLKPVGINILIVFVII